MSQYKADLSYQGIPFQILINPDYDVELMQGSEKVRTFNIQRLELWRHARSILDKIEDAGVRASY